MLNAMYKYVNTVELLTSTLSLQLRLYWKIVKWAKTYIPRYKVNLYYIEQKSIFT